MLPNLETFVIKSVTRDGHTVKLVDAYDFFYDRSEEGVDLVYGTEFDFDFDNSEEKRRIKFKEFLMKANAVYYADPREDFFDYNGWDKAFELKCDYLFMEDLS